MIDAFVASYVWIRRNCGRLWVPLCVFLVVLLFLSLGVDRLSVLGVVRFFDLVSL
jgi:hypothetical protein